MAVIGQYASVVLVEDTPDDERLAVRALQKSGLPVETKVAHDGVEALEMLVPPAGHKFSEQVPSLVLLDLKLPKVSGIEVLRAMRSNPRTQNVPVVVLTSSDEKSDLLTCYQLHCNGYVRKAVDYNEYMDAMQKTLDFWLRINRVPAAPESDTRH